MSILLVIKVKFWSPPVLLLHPLFPLVPNLSREESIIYWVPFNSNLHLKHFLFRSKFSFLLVLSFELSHYHNINNVLYFISFWAPFLVTLSSTSVRQIFFPFSPYNWLTQSIPYLKSLLFITKPHLYPSNIQSICISKNLSGVRQYNLPIDHMSYRYLFFCLSFI